MEKPWGNRQLQEMVSFGPATVLIPLCLSQPILRRNIPQFQGKVWYEGQLGFKG